jgi:polysaccharide biosynthesis transport protein
MSDIQTLPQDQPKRSSNDATMDILKIILRHKSLIALGVVIAMVLGAIYYSKVTPIYQSTTDVLIVNKRAEAVAGNSMQSYFTDYMSTHKALIVSPVVVERAIEQANLASLKTFSQMESHAGLTGAIIRQLSVVSGSSELGQGADNILTLSF